jgi:hypothetical protein
MSRFRDLKVDDVIRVEKDRNKGLLGARLIAFEEGRSLYPPHMTEADILRPSYVYLELTKIEGDQLTGRDLMTLEERVFERQRHGEHLTGKFHERTVRVDGRAKIDVWGSINLTVLNSAGVRTIVEARRATLEKRAADARAQADQYAQGIAALLDKYPSGRKSA